MASDLWSDTQRVAQSAFNDVSNTYQQFLSGTTDPSRRSLNYEIAADAYEPTADDWKDIGRMMDEYDQQNPDPRLTDPNLDPEMDM